VIRVTQDKENKRRETVGGVSYGTASGSEEASIGEVSGTSMQPLIGHIL
jgi:hypothetical protein